MKVLSYGRNRKVILEAARRDPECVLANVLAAHFASSKMPSATSSYRDAAASRLVSDVLLGLVTSWLILAATACLSLFHMYGAFVLFSVWLKETGTSYEKAVFKAVSCLLSENRDDEAAVRIHSEVITIDSFSVLFFLLWFRVFVIRKNQAALVVKNPSLNLTVIIAELFLWYSTFLFGCILIRIKFIAPWRNIYRKMGDYTFNQGQSLLIIAWLSPPNLRSVYSHFSGYETSSFHAIS